ncbi:MAG: 2-amino-4-hydroxy-6-hydroxymethyldihydropteridine diphosphokinase, partial [Pseudobdellovibrionaceae bacterium]
MIPHTRIAIALGSNLGDRKTAILKAVEIMADDFLKKHELSAIYATEPWGITDQPRFLNAVVVGETDWKPPANLNYLKDLERKLGRTETIKNGPRVIDLDLIVFGNETWESP